MTVAGVSFVFEDLSCLPGWAWSVLECINMWIYSALEYNFFDAATFVARYFSVRTVALEHKMTS